MRMDKDAIPAVEQVMTTLEVALTLNASKNGNDGMTFERRDNVIRFTMPDKRVIVATVRPM